MPTYLPPRAGLSLSQAVAEAYASNPGETVLLTLELHHSAFRDELNQPTAARVVNDWTPLQATLEDDAPLNAGEEVTFAGVPFRYAKPEQTDSGSPAAVQIEIDNVSRQLTKYLLQAIDSQEPILLIERVYAASDTSAPHEMPPTRMYLTSCTVGVDTVSAQASFGDLTNRKFPRVTYSRAEFVGLSAR